MNISREVVQKVAHLARIRLQPDHEAQLAQELNKIVSWIELLNEVDTKDVEPLDHAVSYSLRMREDQQDLNTSPEEVLKNAKETVLNFFSVPKVVE